MGHGGWVTACVFSPDGRRLVSGSFDGALKLWDAETGHEIAGIPTPYSLHCVAVHPTRLLLAFGDDAWIVSLVDIRGLEWGGTEGAAHPRAGAATPPDPPDAEAREERRGWRRVLRSRRR